MLLFKSIIKRALIQQEYEREIIKIAACRPDLTIKKIKKEINKLVKTSVEGPYYWVAVCKNAAGWSDLMPWEKESHVSH